MTRTQWAELEIAAACKRENPNWNGEDFDYGCSCYQSALKAFKSLMEDGHSGFSFSITKNILEKLMNDIPLSPITDEDFFTVERGTEEFPAESDEWLKEQKLKSDLQCPRRSSLFRREDLEGNVTYRDIDRAYCINVECPSDTFNSGIERIIDKIDPITMPYMPSKNQYKIYVKTFLTDKAHGDFDVHIITGYEDLNGIYHPYDLWEYYDETGKHVITNAAEKANLLNKRIDKLETKIAAHLYNNIEDYYTDNLWNKKDNTEYNRVKAICTKHLDAVYNELTKLCNCFNKTDDRGVYYMNTWHNHYIICDNDTADKYILMKEFPECGDLIELIDKIKTNIESELNGNN